MDQRNGIDFRSSDIIVSHDFDKLISLENLFSSWKEFKNGKTQRLDVLVFERNLEDNIFSLHYDLKSGRYRHGAYENFTVNDPKPRKISKASVRDRLVHHIAFRRLYEIFEPLFIYHSYSSRFDKGTHLAVYNLTRALRKVSSNYQAPAFVLKCDIKKFFASVPHQKLLKLVKRKIHDEKFLRLIEEIISSFASPVDKNIERERELTGLPIGNVTSQVFANIYLNELDQFIKHKLKVRYYFRYADDFVIVDDNEDYLKDLLINIDCFLQFELALRLHPNKVEIRKFRQGIDFLGYVILPYYTVLRTKTKKRMFRNLSAKKRLLDEGNMDEDAFSQSLKSYLGILSHCEGYGLEKKLRRDYDL